MNLNTSKFTRLAPLVVFTTALVWLVSASSVSAQYSNAVAANNPLAYWRFSEMGNPASGTLQAADSSGNGFYGVYGSGCENGFNGIAGPQSPAFPGFESTNVAVQTETVVTNATVSVPSLGGNNVATICMWIYQSTNFSTNTPGLFFQRGGSTGGSGMGVTAGKLYYDWNNNASNIYQFNSGLHLPTNVWAFVALTVEPAQLTLRLYYVTNGVTNLFSTNNVTAHLSQVFNGTILIGADSYEDRTFNGTIDEVAVFTNTLSASTLGSLFAAGVGATGFAPQISSQPATPSVYTTQTALLTVCADGTPLNYQWKARANGSSGAFTNLANGSKYSGATAADLFITNVVSTDVMQYEVVISNSFGSVTSSVASILLSPITQLTVSNYSFEIPLITPVSVGWWNPPNTFPSSFAWTNNFIESNGYNLGDNDNGHFIAAADGVQAIRLTANRFVSQGIAPTVADTLYTLSFCLLQDTGSGSSSDSVSAQIYDGSNLLGSSNFTVPSTTEIWNTNTLTVLSPHVPAGNLTILFTNVSGPPWLDLVTLSSVLSPAKGVTISNNSFEVPAIGTANGGWYLTNSTNAPLTTTNFSWSNNVSTTYVLATKGAGHYSSAENGVQALWLQPNQHIAQDTGPTASNTFYNLTFYLGADYYTTDPNGGSLYAQILDGTNVLAASDFSAIPYPNLGVTLWSPFTLTAISSAVPAGDLTIEFTGTNDGLNNSGGHTGPWIDNVSLTATANPTIVSLTNGSFEIPAITPASVGWWTNALPASFGWSNDLGTNSLANSHAAHFSAAEDGSQALLLDPNQYISQVPGPTASNTVYNLTFFLLQDTNTPNSSATLSAEILDGANVLASNSFTVAAWTNVWEECLLTATSPAVPAGNLTIQFTGLSSGGSPGPWIDKVSLTSYAEYVTTAIITPPTPPTLSFQFTGGQLTLTWSAGALLQATNVAGPWVTNLNSSPYTVSLTNSSEFFQVVVP